MISTLPFDHTAALADSYDVHGMLCAAVAKHLYGPALREDPGLLASFFKNRKIDGAVRISTKAAVDPIDTDSGLALSKPSGSAFVSAAVRPSVLARLGATRVPSSMAAGAVGTLGAIAYWHGQSLAKPVSTLGFDPLSLAPLGVIAQVIVTNEVIRLGTIDVLAATQQRLLHAVTRELNDALLNPLNSGVSGIKPASLTSGVTPIPSAATDLLTDVGLVIAALSDGAPERPTLILSHANALRLRVQDLEAQGVRVIVDAAAGAYLIGVDAALVRYMDDGAIEEITKEADVQMRDDPTDPATATAIMTSLWQRNLLGVRAEMRVNWWSAGGAVTLLEV